MVDNARRVIIVSDTLPFSLNHRGDKEEGDVKITSVLADLSISTRRKRRARSNSITLNSNFVLDKPKTEENSTIRPPGLELVERQNHAAFWVASHLNAEVIHVGKPVGERDSPAALRELYWTRKQSVPVILDEATLYGHWDGFCRSCLWPLFHYILWESGIGEGREDWAAYVRANEVFAEAIMSVYREGDIVWVLDYQLLLLPAILRAKAEKAKEVLAGMLGANVIGFQTYSYARHFISSCTRILGNESTSKGVDNAGVPVDVVVQPIGVDPMRVKKMQSGTTVQARAASFREVFAGRKVILGLESADQCRGIIHKLKSFEKLLSMYSDLIGNVALVQIVFSHTDQRGKGDSKITELVSSINGTYGSLDFNPVHVYHQVVESDEYFALLTIADMLLITSERDSVNTLVLDYIACQDHAFGLPVISEFIGLVSMLPRRLHVNPWDHVGTATTIQQVLTMPMEERRSLHNRISGFVWSNDVQYWVDSFMRAIQGSLSTTDIYLPTPFLSLDRILSSYEGAESRLLLLDYDGTLTPIRRVPSAATPSQEVISSLRVLASDPKNRVYIISGRDQWTLEEWLGTIPQLGMSAEHGCFLRPIPEIGESANWTTIIDVDELVWKQDVTPIMEYYCERTPGSFIEFKTASITWHYRLADPEFGSWQTKELQTHLEQSIATKYAVEIVAGKKNLEVRPRSSNKGEIIRMLLERHGMPEFILCAGDDKTDEDMFRALAALPETRPEEGRIFTCSIGTATKKTLARYHVNTPEQIVSLLLRLAQLVEERSPGVTI